MDTKKRCGMMRPDYMFKENRLYSKFEVNTIGKALPRNKILTKTFSKFCMSTPVLKLEMTMKHIC